ncbi:TetR/AcrR family transcriptional regulator [Gordonia westfalica]|uniref:TetR/AcrR family transcriptional regulator n=1 Tax=Gordonia westfalica TaxID=158898 RepID=A0ABU2GTP7_9ACTN|nr:TetR/AcrR family transcriptional regulator [Gordonia westfalica]MDS1114823.1 TetR/AcrR family transcriptional regulator [Gordonia westfalica]
MTTVLSRDAYFETGLAVLSDLGYGGLKLAEVCSRLRVTSGSFYHYFANWADYTEGLLAYWLEARTLRAIELLTSINDPHERLSTIIEVGLGLPHGAERAIRTWSNLDDRARQTQEMVDRKRYEVVFASVAELVDDRQLAHHFANWSVFLLVGYEQTSLPQDREALRDIMMRLMRLLEEHRAVP